MFSKILVVCVGNICRSPMAACILKARLADKGFIITSAGVAALVGEAMDPVAQEVLARHGYAHNEHKAQQLHRSHVQEADIILVMETKLINVVFGIAAEARGKTFTMGKWQMARDIPDPYKQSRAMFEHTFALINEAIDTWIPRLD